MSVALKGIEIRERELKHQLSLSFSMLGGRLVAVDVAHHFACSEEECTYSEV